MTITRLSPCAMLASFALLAAGCHQAAAPLFPSVPGTMKVALLTTGPVTDWGEPVGV